MTTSVAPKQKDIINKKAPSVTFLHRQQTSRKLSDDPDSRTRISIQFSCLDKKWGNFHIIAKRRRRTVNVLFTYQFRNIYTWCVKKKFWHVVLWLENVPSEPYVSFISDFQMDDIMESQAVMCVPVLVLFCRWRVWCFMYSLCPNKRLADIALSQHEIYAFFIK